jgi:norsolorinic acid ketoreductase
MQLNSSRDKLARWILPLLVQVSCLSFPYSTALMSGSSTGRATIASATLDQLRSDFETNTIGPIVLFQAFESLLAASDVAGGAKFVIVSSILGQITEASDYSYDAYGISKAGANFVAKKLSQEVPSLISFPMQ